MYIKPDCCFLRQPLPTHNVLLFSAQGMAKGKIVLTGEIKVNIQAGELSG